jgi:hypothetical protein
MVTGAIPASTSTATVSGQVLKMAYTRSYAAVNCAKDAKDSPDAEDML